MCVEHCRSLGGSIGDEDLLESDEQVPCPDSSKNSLSSSTSSDLLKELLRWRRRLKKEIGEDRLCGGGKAVGEEDDGLFEMKG